MKFEVTILGSSSATPVYNRNPTAQLLNINEGHYLVDCGEGTQQQLIRFGLKASKIDHIFISHLHGDHYFGLIGLLSSMHLNGRIKPIRLFAPEAILEILNLQFKYSDTVLRYPIEFYPVDPLTPKIVFSNADVEVETIILNHRVPCTGFKFTEKLRSRKLNIEKLTEAGVPVNLYPLLKRGLDLTTPEGGFIQNKAYTFDPDPVRSYGYCSDTLFDPRYFSSILNCDTLYHEATFLHDMLERANQTHHTTALQAAEVAKLTGAKKLLIGHFSSRYKTLLPLLEEARIIFPATELAVEGKVYSV